MPFPKSAQRKGGRASASDHQKTIAKQTIMETRPWEKSTGPTTQEGLQATTGNVRLESILRFGYVFESKDSAVQARRAFLARVKELHKHLKSQGLGVVNSFVTETRCNDDQSINTRFSATLRGPTPEGLAIGKQWFSDRTWIQ
ncbi:MAG: hypothetical protein H7237_00535 [Alkalinema sp. FL-bin-369]|nr:hypothetical protein [Leptolyngbyaceae cyanobacterium LF-bin-369]